MSMLEETIKGFVKEGIPVTLVYNEQYGLGYDLNTSAEMNLIVYPAASDTVLCVGRFGQETVKESNVEDLTTELSHRVKECMYEKPF